MIRKLALVAALGLLAAAPSLAQVETPGVPSRDLPGQANGTPPSFSGKAYRQGVVAVSHPLAAEAGARMLEQGGNAIDAAAAIQFALNVVEPEFSGIGGGGFMMIHLAATGETFAVESRERAPAAADATLFVDPGTGRPQNFTVASTSGQAVGVPGTLMGVHTALEGWGTMSLAEVLEPAIRLAEDGFRVNRVLAADAPSERTSYYEATRALFRPGGVPVAEGHLLKQPDLAKTFRILATRGIGEFYGKDGEIARAIVEAQRQFRTNVPILDSRGNVVGHADGKPGLMETSDLAAYEVEIRRPIVGDYRGYTIAAMSPPSSGGLTMIQALEMLERFPLGDASQGYGFGAPKTLHLMAEAMRLAFADRAVWMGDEDFVPVPKAELLAPRYVDARSRLIDPERRMPSAVADNPFDYLAKAPGAGTKTRLAAAEPLSYPGGYTTHFSVVDRWGNVVSYTTTIEAGWGTGIMVPGYGFMLNNELTDFNFGSNPHPYLRDAEGNPLPGANDVQGGKRPRSSMTPAILLKDGKPFAAYGSPGGATIINSVFNVTVNLIDHGMSIEEAVEAPRISVTSAAGTISWEPGLEAAIAAISKPVAQGGRYGHPVATSPGNIGNVNAVIIDLRTGKQYGAVDSTREGGLVGLPR